MKQLKTTFFFVLLSFSSFAKDSAKIEFKRFALGFHASPDYCYRTISSLSNNINFREMTEEPIWGFTGGANFSYFIKKQFAISLGVNFSQKGYKIASMPTVDVNGTAGNAQIRYNYNYLEIPVKANFVLGKKKIRLLTSIGATSAFLLYEKTIRTIEYPDGTKSTTKDKPNYIYNPFNLFLTGSIGADFLLGKKMALRVEPSYSYGLLETIAVPFSEHLWSAGLNIGCYLYF